MTRLLLSSLFSLSALLALAPPTRAEPPDPEADCKSCDDGLTECIRECACEEPVPGAGPSGVTCDVQLSECKLTCRHDAAECWDDAGCDAIDPDCEQCLGCASGCDPGDVDCADACEGWADACFEVNDCGGPYAEVTPICYYLERGIDDFVPFGTDPYVVLMPTVERVSDITKLDFGLDLPATQCVENPHGIPCADESHPTRWLVDALTLSIGGVDLFHAEKAAGQAFLLAVGGGTGDEGIAGFDHAELRQNPMWGLSEHEITRFFPALPLPDDAEDSIGLDDMLAIVGQPTFDRVTLMRLFESAFGRILARDVKAGAATGTGCEGAIYCDNSTDIVTGWRGTFSGRKPSCDLSGPCLVGRGTMPWLEVARVAAGEQDRILIDVDLEIAEHKADFFDCPSDDAPCWGGPHGSKPKWLADLGVSFELEPICVPKPGSNDELHTIRFRPHNITARVEDGTLKVDLLLHNLDVICKLFGGKLEDTGLGPICDGGLEGPIQEVLAGAFEKVKVMDDLAECPAPVAFVSPSAAVTLNLPVPEAPTVQRTIQSAQLVRWARLRHTPGGDAQAALEDAYGAHVADLSLNEVVVPGVEDAVAGPEDKDQKVRFPALDELAAPLCALLYDLPLPPDDDPSNDGDTIRVCDPALDLAAVSLPPPSIGPGIDPFACSAAIAPGDPDNDRACEALARIKAFLMQPPIYTHCVLPNAQGYDPDLFLAELWLAFSAAVDGCGASFQLDVESFLPVTGVDLAITTGREGSSDTFPFVRLTEDKAVKGHYGDLKCRNRLDHALVPDDPYDDCTDPDDASLAGTLGCPCADLDVTQFDDLLSDGGRADGAGSHLDHGLAGMGQYCRDDSAVDDGTEVVCGSVTLSGEAFPLCQQCGRDTNVGCACASDSDCGGIEDDLVCVGSSASEGWAGDAHGTCLPDRGSEAGREALEAMRWFCLDSCDAIDGNAGATGACYYNQLGVDLDHGTCVDSIAQCDGQPRATCEAGGERCAEDAAGDFVCAAECLDDGDCDAIGFPAEWVCDVDAVMPHCVPAECAGDGVWSFCSLYR